MRKFCVFTQTYGDGRAEIFDYRHLDKVDIFFRNQFDLNYYSFHNSSEDYTNRIKMDRYFSLLKNVEFNSFNNIEYTHILRDHVFKYLTDNKFTHFIYLQDDVFSIKKIHPEFRIKELINFIKNGDYNMIYLEKSASQIGVSEDRLIKEDNGFKTYASTSVDFLKATKWAWDDGPFVARIDWLLDKVYDSIYLDSGTIGRGEAYLNRKIKRMDIERITTNLPIYKRYSIVGASSEWAGIRHRKELKDLFIN